MNHTVQLSSRSVDVSVQGRGPALLLVQGGAARAEGAWLDLPEALSSVGTVISLDRPGTGRSPVPGQRLSLAQQAEHLTRVISAVGAGPVTVVAHSLGGPVSIELAADFPDLVAGLVLLDPTPLMPRTVTVPLAATTVLLRNAERLPRMKPVLDRAVIAKLRKQVPDGSPGLDLVAEGMIGDDHMAQLAALLRGFPQDAADLAERLRRQPLTTGGVLATAERKPGSVIAKAHAEMAHLTGTELQVWEGTTHVLQLQRPERVVAALEAVLAAR